MAEDWRLTVTLDEEDRAGGLFAWLGEHEVEADVRRRLGDRVVVSGDERHVFLYADTEAAAREAERVVRDVLAAHGASGAFALERWHPAAEEWEDASVPLPETPTEEAREHAQLEAAEAAEAEETGAAEWEVRVELPARADAAEFAERLEREGRAVVRRWNYVLVGATTEDEARELAERLEREAPPGSTVHAEASGASVWRVLGPNPFAIFGGLGL